MVAKVQSAHSEQHVERNVTVREAPASPFGEAPNPAELLRPIEFLNSDHQRQRMICNLLDAFVADLWQPGCQDMAASLAKFATNDLAWSLADEADLIALTSRLCESSKSATQILAELPLRHTTLLALVPQVSDGLERMAAGAALVRPLDFIIFGAAIAGPSDREYRLGGQSGSAARSRKVDGGREGFLGNLPRKAPRHTIGIAPEFVKSKVDALGKLTGSR